MNSDQNFLDHLKNKLGVQSQSSSSCSNNRENSLTKQEQETNFQESQMQKGQKRRRLKKKAKSMGPQMLNKLFKDIQANENSNNDQSKASIYREQKSELNLILKPKQNTQQNNHFEKLNQKVTYMRNRRSFQNAHADARYKRHIIEKVQDLKDVDEVQIEIEAPQIVGGKNKNVDNALYWKNVLSQKPIDQKSKSQAKAVEEQKKPPQKYQNRHQFFNQINQQIKKRKSVANTQAVQECFKKSSFNDLQQDLNEFELNNQRSNNLLDLSCKQNNSQYYTNSRPNKTNSKIIENSIINNKKVAQQQKTTDKKSEASLKQKNTGVKSIQIKQKKQQQIVSKEIKEEQSAELEQVSEKIFKKLKKVAKRISQRKSIKQTIKEKKKNKEGKEGKEGKKAKSKQQQPIDKQYLKGYFEQEAQDSNREGKIKDKQEDYDGVLLDEQLADLIDNSVCFKEEDQRIALRKYIQDQKLQDERLLQKIKKSIFGKKTKAKRQITQSEKKRRQRMKEAANKYELQDKNFLAANQSQKNTKDIQFKDSQSQNSNNSAKLKQLQDQYGAKKRLKQPLNKKRQMINPKLQVGLMQMNGFLNQKKKKQTKKRGLLTQSKTSITAFRTSFPNKKNSKSNKKQQNINIFNCSYSDLD